MSREKGDSCLDRPGECPKAINAPGGDTRGDQCDGISDCTGGRAAGMDSQPEAGNQGKSSPGGIPGAVGQGANSESIPGMIGVQIRIHSDRDHLALCLAAIF